MTEAGNAGRPEPAGARFSALGWRPGIAPLAVVAVSVVLLLAYLTGVLPAAGAVVALAITAVFGALFAVSAGPDASERLLPNASSDAAPETGIWVFAEALPDPCLVLERNGIVRYVNQRASAVFAIRSGEPLSFRIRAPDILAAFERVASGGAPERVEFSERVPTERWFAAWFARLESLDERFVILILDDLSEWRRMDRIRVDFVANASHELRTPLASLAGFVETLQGPARDDPAARERFLSIMHDQAMRMKRLIDDLLSLSRIELKVHVPPSGTVDLPPLIRHVAEALEPLARELDVAIECHLPAGGVTVTGERDELIQVFQNLIENAIKYGQSGKRVAVTLTPPAGGEGPSVAVRDFGAGIAEEHLPRLTERFYRIDVEASRQHRGTGLGLAIVKHILTRHGARLAIDSQPGEGATFTVVFPAGTSAA